MDSTSVDLDNIKNKNQDEKKLRIGLLKYDKSGVDKEINESMENSAEIFKNLGYEVSEIELPNIKYSVPCYYILAPAEVSSNWPDLTASEDGLLKKGKI